MKLKVEVFLKSFLIGRFVPRVQVRDIRQMMSHFTADTDNDPDGRRAAKR